MLDHIEQYKTQQLERLRENYTQQVEMNFTKRPANPVVSSKSFVCQLLRSALYSEAMQLLTRQVIACKLNDAGKKKVSRFTV